MANPNAPFSFRPWASARVHEYPLSTGYSMALYLGDLVKTDGSNNIVTAAAGDQVRGVFAGVLSISPPMVRLFSRKTGSPQRRNSLGRSSRRWFGMIPIRRSWLSPLAR